jgi:hypothetical protein
MEKILAIPVDRDPARPVQLSVIMGLMALMILMYINL